MHKIYMGNTFSVCQRHFPELYAKPSETLVTLDLEEEVAQIQNPLDRTYLIEAKQIISNNPQIEFTNNSKNSSRISKQLVFQDETNTLKKKSAPKESFFQEPSQKDDENTQKEKSQLCGESSILYKPPTPFKDGSNYHGQWKDGRMHGFGKIIYTNGIIYTGNWVNGLPQGKGKIDFLNGNFYEGEILKGAPNGQGIQVNPFWTYDGSWLNGKMNGFGKKQWVNGNYYEGHFSEGQRSGVGKYHWANGQEYVGQWVENRMEGFGKMSLASNQAEYSGQWLNNLMEGEGIYIWSNGSEFRGKYKQDLKHGKGIYIVPNQFEYEGEWYEGIPINKGLLKLAAEENAWEVTWQDRKLIIGKKVNL